MGRIIGLVSGKGGVGKTTITACLGAALSQRGHRVLMTDGDFGLRDLDLVLGKQNDVFFDATDVYKNKNLVNDAVVSVSNNLDFLPASQSYRWEEVGRKKYRNMIEKISKSYDYVLIDAPAGIGRGADTILDIAERILVITQPLWVALRNAGRMIQVCREKRKFDYAVVFNAMHQSQSKDLDMSTMMDSLGAEYIGSMLPYTEEIIEYTQDGHLHELKENRFMSMLSPLISYVETGRTWEDEDILNSYDTLQSPSKQAETIVHEIGDSSEIKPISEVKQVIEEVHDAEIDKSEYIDEGQDGVIGEVVDRTLDYTVPRVVLMEDDIINHRREFKALWKQCSKRNRQIGWRKRR